MISKYTQKQNFSSLIGTWALLLFMILHSLCVQAQESIPLVTGPDRTILLLGFEGSANQVKSEDEPRSMLPPARGSKKVIFKSTDQGRTYDQIGERYFPESPMELRERLEEKGLLNEVLSQLNANTVEEVYQQLTTQGLGSLGMVLILPELSELFGLSFIDQHPGTPQAASYRVEYINQDAEVTATLFADSRNYTPDWDGRLTLHEYLPLDSSITIVWSGAEFMNSEQLPLVGQIYKRNGHHADFQAIQEVIISNSDTGLARVGFSESIEPNQHYAYFIQIEDLAGNIGERSDTLSFYSFDVGSLEHIQNLSVQDSSSGLHLSWDPLPDQAVYSAIQILKSRQLGSDYVVLDTIPARSTSYLDSKVVPSTNYFYKIRPLIYQIPGEDVLLFSEASGHHSGENRPAPLAPQQIQINPVEEGIKVSWSRGSELNLFAYYVLRGHHPDALQIVSGAIQDTVYIDTAFSSNYSGQLHYAVQAMDMAQQWSDTSNFASIHVDQFLLIPAPGGIQSSHGAVGARLQWEDSRVRDTRITGFHMYRRQENEEYFTRLTESPLVYPYYEDLQNDRTLSYQYGVTSVDAWGNESLMSPLSSLGGDISDKLALPGELRLRNLRDGIEISWPIPLQVESGLQYQLYRRSDTEDSPTMIRTVNPDQVYIDRETRSGILYHYSISVIWNRVEGSVGHEQSLRRNE